MIIDVDVWLAHYGTPRKSGRYKWGSGKDEKVYEGSFLDITTHMLKTMPQKTVAEGFKMTTTELRNARSIESNERKMEKHYQIQKLIDKGMSDSAIGRQLGKNESSIRSTRAALGKEQKKTIHTIADILQKDVDKHKYIQVGAGVEHLSSLGVSANNLGVAVAILKERGYKQIEIQVPNVGSPGNLTTIKVIAHPEATYQEVKQNYDKIRLPAHHSDDNGRSFKSNFQDPLQLSSKRVKVLYKDDGGADADGLIHVRPGIDDISIGGKSYAQVRIAVDGTHYMKGVAVYKDDLPKGVDVVYHTTKTKTGNKLDAMKPMELTVDGKINKENPFGAQVSRQVEHPDGSLKSVMNILNEEGTWKEWKQSLSSQVLSKQTPHLAKQQLDVKKEKMRLDLDELKQLTNPAIREHLLSLYASGADSAAQHLEAAHLPRQSTHVLLPVKSLKQSEVYSPNHIDGETVVLIRFPHGGKFEIPQLTVNNKNREAIKMMGKNAPDAVGIHPKVAEKLSGADFDGDTVLVIPNHPNNPRRIVSEPMIKSLKGFDPKGLYKLSDDVPKMKPKTKGVEMGKISNLITDMTIKGASNDELARAVKHSMVVIDAEKHHLDYKRSAKDHAIQALEAKYQLKENGKAGGASTLISRAGSKERVPETVLRRASEGGPIDPKTGRLVYVPKTFVNKAGEVVNSKIVEEYKISRTNDAHTLVSKERTAVEVVYADHSNALKSMANEARKEVYKFKPTRVDLNAKRAYKTDVDSLVAKLKIAKANAPFERQAQIFANAAVAKMVEANPNMEQARLKKIRGQALATARVRVGASKTKIVPTDSEWAAIQAGAVSHSQLKQILANADLPALRQLATPRSLTEMSPTRIAQAQAMANRGFTQAEIASALGVSASTITSHIN